MPSIVGANGKRQLIRKVNTPSFGDKDYWKNNKTGEIYDKNPTSSIVTGSNQTAKTGISFTERTKMQRGGIPTVISDSNIRENVIPDTKKRAKEMLGTQYDQFGEKTNKDSTIDTSQQDGEDPYAPIYESVIGSKQNQDNAYEPEMRLIDQMQRTSDRRTQQALSGIKSRFDVRRSDLEAKQESNRLQNQNALLTSGGEQGGSYRYAPLSTNGVVSSVERGFIRDMSILDLEESQVRNEALSAQEDNDYRLLGSKLDLLAKKRQEKLDVVNTMYQAMIDEEKDKKKNIDSIMILAGKNGASREQLNAISSAPDLASAVIAAGDSLQDGEYANYARSARKAGQVPVSPNVYFSKQWTYAPSSSSGSGSGVTDYNGDFAATVGLAANNMGSVYGQKALKDQLEGAIAVEDWPSAATAITQATANGLSGENRTKFENASNDAGLLADLDSAIKAYKAAGGDMNLAKSVALDSGKSLGILAADKPYAALATQLDAVFQQYRQNMTGAAFGAQESAEYQRVRPNKAGSFNLNESTIEGASNYANSYIRTNVRSKTGQGGVEILDRAKPHPLVVQESGAEQAVLDVASKNPDAANAIRPLVLEGVPYQDIIEAFPEFFPK